MDWFARDAVPDTLFPWYRRPLEDAFAGGRGPVVRNERQATLGVERLRREVVARDRHATSARREDARKGAQRRGLAGAVGSDQAEDLAGRHREVQPADRRAVAVAFDQPLDTDE